MTVVWMDEVNYHSWLIYHCFSAYFNLYGDKGTGGLTLKWYMVTRGVLTLKWFFYLLYAGNHVSYSGQCAAIVLP